MMAQCGALGEQQVVLHGWTLDLGEKVVKKGGWGSKQPGYGKSGVPQKVSLYLRADKELFTSVRK